MQFGYATKDTIWHTVPYFLKIDEIQSKMLLAYNAQETMSEMVNSISSLTFDSYFPFHSFRNTV